MSAAVAPGGAGPPPPGRGGRRDKPQDKPVLPDMKKKKRPALKKVERAGKVVGQLERLRFSVTKLAGLYKALLTGLLPLSSEPPHL